MKHTKQQNEELFGKASPSDYAPGDAIRYQKDGDLAEGTVVFTRAAGPVYEGGPVLGAGHIVESGRGWPRFVPLRDAVGQ